MFVSPLGLGVVPGGGTYVIGALLVRSWEFLGLDSKGADVELMRAMASDECQGQPLGLISYPIIERVVCHPPVATRPGVHPCELANTLVGMNAAKWGPANRMLEAVLEQWSESYALSGLIRSSVVHQCGLTFASMVMATGFKYAHMCFLTARTRRCNLLGESLPPTATLNFLVRHVRDEQAAAEQAPRHIDGPCAAEGQASWVEFASRGLKERSDKIVAGVASNLYDPHSIVRFLRYSKHLKTALETNESLDHALLALFTKERAHTLKQEAELVPGSSLLKEGRKHLYTTILNMRRLKHEFEVASGACVLSTIAVDASSKGGEGQASQELPRVL